MATGYSEDEENTKAIVIDNGTYNIKAGFSGEDEPSTLFRTIYTKLSTKCRII